MIKSDELRLWNFVFDKEQNKIDIIDVIEENRVSLLYSKFPYTPINLIQPVELTPDILEAAGFTNGIKTIQTSFLETELYVDLMDGDAGFNKHGLWFPCKYLHQLQNLYFALTGEELQIDINKINNNYERH